MTVNKRFHIALIVNPVAGLGGPSGLKGSDAPDTIKQAELLGVHSKIPERIHAVLTGLSNYADQLHFSTMPDAMGQDYLEAHGGYSFDIVVPKLSSTERGFHFGDTQASDTRNGVSTLVELDPDLLLFAGGDGTARDVCAVLNDGQLCLGIPSGVKMHSGVFAVTPSAVVSVVESLLNHQLVAAASGEVRDIDEQSFQQGKVITRYYGELLVPDDQLLVQSVKCSGLPDDEMALNEIAAYVEETLEDGTLYLLGSGGSLNRIKQTIGISDPTLLGVDAWCDGELVGRDLNEPQLFELIREHASTKLFISVIGGQGIVLGRGNQQLSARILNAIGIENVQLIGTQQRLLALDGKALRVDTGDDALDRALSGYRKVLCGYDDFVVYEVAYSA